MRAVPIKDSMKGSQLCQWRSFHRPLNTNSAGRIISKKEKKKRMQLHSICTKKEYLKDGEKKTVWYKVGVLKVAESGKSYIKLYHQPETEFFIFNQDENSKEAEPLS